MTPSLRNILASFLLLTLGAAAQTPVSEPRSQDTDAIPFLSWRELENFAQAALTTNRSVKSCGNNRLFLPDEVLSSIVTPNHFLENADVFIEAKNELARYGIDYLLIMVPGTSLIYPDALDDNHPMTPDGLPYRIDLQRKALLDTLASNGVHFLDLTPSFIQARREENSDPRLRADTHWSCMGAVIAAGQAASWIKSRPWSGSIPKEKLAAEWRLRTASSVEPSLEYYRSANGISSNQLVQTLRERIIDGWTENPSNSIILVTGDSNTIMMPRDSSCFAAQLAFELQTPVANAGALYNPVFTELATRYRCRPAELLRHKAVIHVVCSRTFALYRHKYYRIFPSAINPETLKTAPSSTNPATPLEIEATLVKTSSSRMPSQIRPYDSAVMCAVFRVEKVLAGSYDKKEIAAASWNIIEGFETTWKHLLAPGRRYRLSLEPLEMHSYIDSLPKDFDAIEDTLDTETYWCREFFDPADTGNRAVYVISNDPDALKKASAHIQETTALQ